MRFSFCFQLLTTLALFGFLLGSCVRTTEVTLDEGATVPLPQGFEKKTDSKPVRLFLLDPRQRPSTEPVVIKNGEDPPKDWEETNFTAEVTSYVVPGLEYEWGAAVYEFTDVAADELGEKMLQFAREQTAQPGHYLLKDENPGVENGLQRLDVVLRHSAGTSRVDARLILRKNKVFVAFYQANLNKYPEDQATHFIRSLKVNP